jgi:MFS family permease
LDLPFAAGNFLGPVFLGRLFDTIGRRVMIAATYALSGLLLAVAGYFFAIGVLSATGQTIACMVIFFFASAAASSAYLTVGETFPLEVRALAIAFFYAIGTGIGGVAGPWLFGALIDTGSRWSVYGGYVLGSALMIAAALIAARLCVAAEAISRKRRLWGSSRSQLCPAVSGSTHSDRMGNQHRRGSQWQGSATLRSS